MSGSNKSKIPCSNKIFHLWSIKRYHLFLLKPPSFNFKRCLVRCSLFYRSASETLNANTIFILLSLPLCSSRSPPQALFHPEQVGGSAVVAGSTPAPSEPTRNATVANPELLGSLLQQLMLLHEKMRIITAGQMTSLFIQVSGSSSRSW